VAALPNGDTTPNTGCVPERPRSPAMVRLSVVTSDLRAMGENWRRERDSFPPIPAPVNI
jgi:hypothetical protein